MLLLLLGGALLKIAFNGDYLRYVRPTQQPWIITAGAVMVALGALAIVRDIRGSQPSGAACGPSGADACGGVHGAHHSAKSAWLLMVPVLTVFLIAPPALGSDSVVRTPRTQQRSQTASGSASFPPLPEGDPVPLSVSNFVARAGWDSKGTLNDRTVRLTGFIAKDGGTTKLARLVITCCAADAFPVTARLRGEQAGEVAKDVWVEVTGKVVPGTATSQNRYTPDLTVESLREVSMPADPYEY